MREPRAAEGWLNFCRSKGHGPRGQFWLPLPLICIDCARAYRLQGVREALERAAKEAETCLITSVTSPNDSSPLVHAGRKEARRIITATIRALKDTPEEHLVKEDPDYFAGGTPW